MASEPRPVRCAIYTRKSTEHGLELEFNSLDAQREACEAYVKSQASQGWRVLPQPYDDPAYSGGNLERPALKQLLADIEAGKVDVVVVYKIDRLTRSLADFAKLVEAFDARSISFVAVTQQFNTTSSMGRLTLNVLLSFAQFERELSSERVRDKIAASRRKGKWTGGTVPLGYDSKDKKLVINKSEAETVRTIFKRYLELGSLSKLIADLDKRGIVTKRRDTKVKKYNGGIPFTYGPLAYFLKNRVYLGEIHHGGKWFKGEHQAIVDRETFEQVQELLKSNSNGRKVMRAETRRLLTGKLYDSNGHRMRPSFSTKNGVRYRFYISTALLGPRKKNAGSVPRVSAKEIEDVVVNALRSRFPDQGEEAELMMHLASARLSKDEVILVLHGSEGTLENGRTTSPSTEIQIPWHPSKDVPAPISGANIAHTEVDQKVLQAITRAHGWLRSLANGDFTSIEQLATAVKLHPKIIRKELRLAFLSPYIVGAILNGDSRPPLASLRDIAALSWQKQVTTLT